VLPAPFPQMQSLFRSLGLGAPAKLKHNAKRDTDFAKDFEVKLDLRRPASRRVLAGTDLLGGGYAGPAYALAPLDEDATLVERAHPLSPRPLSVAHKQRAGSEGEEDSDDDGSALVYIIPSTRDSVRISKRQNAQEPESEARRSKALSSASSVHAMADLGFSMANAAPKSMLPSFVSSLDGCVIGRQPDEGETRPPRDLCQDEIDFDAKDDGVLLGVFDGHGPDGHAVASMCASDLVSVIRDEQEHFLKRGEVEQALQEGIKSLQRRLDETPPHRIDTDESGTTATVVFATGKKIYVVNVGDSRAVGARRRTDDTYAGEELSFDHHFTVQAEAARVVARGGRVEPVFDSAGRAIGPPRCWLQNKDVPGLMVSRSLGDRVGKSIGVIAEPYSMHSDKPVSFIVCASDGLWEVMTGADSCGVVASALNKGGVGADVNFSELLCVEARRRWIVQEGAVMDDISCIVVVFAPPA
jgi:serine/threonine protein phosphatase PrpC